MSLIKTFLLQLERERDSLMKPISEEAYYALLKEWKANHDSLSKPK
tara:strand:- start:164 stop:301 length:138 start_codon:yes stop_codon:yes gene_type:complete